LEEDKKINISKISITETSKPDLDLTKYTEVNWDK
jgi:hypothetical protein